MHADLQGSLEQVHKTWWFWEHRGKALSKDQVIKILSYGLDKGYKYSDQFSNEEVDEILGWTKENEKWDLA
ncbi:hypothetical protein [Flectobacillus sp. BAB-3569]|uniref:hypothetical protein n=1 Tax=Flectobacillus sp. BAB-3569 TaxID=1509483 RepID=UPI000BA460E0|nr:hypothetical protein [Flectobacillus sp. BAB-3569]PAC27842.1 hypothetical protein BWI92_21765 [Flectobacillus sp. BAB-3569]